MVVLLLSACASSPRIDMIAPGQSVAVVKTTATTGADMRFKNEAVASDAGKGAGSGALAGAAWGLACGPLAIACSPIGALAGAIAGGTAGALVGSARGLSAEQKAAVNQGLQDYLSGHDLEQDLVDTLSDRASASLNVIAPPAPSTVALQMRTLALSGKGREQLNLTMSVRVSVSVTDQDGKIRQRHHDFDYLGPDSPVQAWVDNANDFIARRFEDARLTLADNIAIALTRRN